MTESNKGILAAIAASAIWGGMYAVSSVVLRAVPPITLVAVRMTVAACALFLLVLVLRKPLVLSRVVLWRVMLMGVIGNAFSIVAQFEGTRLGGAALGSLITTAAPVVNVALSSVFLKERVTGRAWLGLGLALLGVYALSGSGNASSAGVLWLVAAAISWGLLSFVGGQVVAKTDAFVVTAYTSAVAAGLTWCLVPLELQRATLGTITPTVVLGVLYIGIVSTALAFALWVYGVARAGSVRSGLAFFAQPLVGSVLGFLVLGEHLQTAFFVGGALLLAGAWLAQT